MAEEARVKSEGGSNGGSEHIQLKVVGQDQSEIDFKMKKTTPMRKLMDAYCNRQGVSPDSLRFYTPDGDRIMPEKTVEEMGLEDGDTIDVMQQQTGGC